MGKVAVRPSQAVAQLLKQRRTDLGLTLREVQERTEALGHPVFFTTLRRIERGVVDPGVQRLHVLLQLYEVPPNLVPDLLGFEQFAGELPDAGGPQELLEGARKHWEAGNAKQALAHLFVLRAQAPQDVEARYERQRALLGFAFVAGSLGKYRLARHIIDDLLVEPPDPRLLVPTLIRAAGCWHWLGSGEVALAFLDRAQARVAPDDHKQRAWICHSRASTFVTLRLFADAEREIGNALDAYAKAEDAYGADRCLGVRVRLKFAQGDLKGAHATARAAREHAARHGHERLRTMHTMHEGHALVCLGEPTAGLAALDEALSRSIAAQDTLTQFYAHYYLWKAHSSLGNPQRADVELNAARYFVRFVDEVTPETGEIRSMVTGKTGDSRSPGGGHG